MKTFMQKLISFISGIFKAGSPESSKRVIAFICLLGLLIMAGLNYFFEIKANNKEIAAQIISCFEFIILFAMGFTAFENVSDIFKNK